MAEHMQAVHGDQADEMLKQCTEEGSGGMMGGSGAASGMMGGSI